MGAVAVVVPLCLVAAWPLSAVQSQQPISHFDLHASCAGCVPIKVRDWLPRMKNREMPGCRGCVPIKVGDWLPRLKNRERPDFQRVCANQSERLADETEEQREARLCSLASLCSSVSVVCLSLLCCKASALSFAVLVARLALSLIFRFLSLSSLCSADPEARRVLSLSLLWRSLLVLISADSEDGLEVESILAVFVYVYEDVL